MLSLKMFFLIDSFERVKNDSSKRISSQFNLMQLFKSFRGFFSTGELD